MAYNLKKDYLKDWDLEHINEENMANIENDDDDDQDIYISERSSIASSNDMNQMPNPVIKRLPTPTTPSILLVSKKIPQALRYPYNEIPENPVRMLTPFQVPRKEENKKKKDLRKGPPNQKKVISFYGAKPTGLGDHYHPPWYYNKINNPDWSPRHRQTGDSQVVPHESVDPSQHALTTLPLKPRRQQQPRNIRHNHIPTNHSNQDKQRLDHSENTSIVSTHITSHENHENNYQKHATSSLKDSDHDEHKILLTTRRTISRQQRKVKNENDWTDHYTQSFTNGKPFPDSSSLIITSNSIPSNRSKHRSKLSDKNSVVTDLDENVKCRHQHLYHQYPYQNQNQSHNSPSIPSQQPYQHQSQQHLHIRRRPPSGSYISSDVHVVDVSFKRTDRPSYTQQIRDPFLSPVPPINHQTHYFPPIVRDNHQQKTHTPRFPSEYYGTLARQTHGKDWEESLEIPKIYKPDPQTRFYDRYLHTIVDKRLAA